MNNQLIPFLPLVGWPQIIAAVIFLVGLALVLMSRRIRKNDGEGRNELRLFVAGSALCLGAAVVGWITL